MEGANLTQIYCKYLCKYHSTSLYNYYMLIKMKRKSSNREKDWCYLIQGDQNDFFNKVTFEQTWKMVRNKMSR
jgi:hypothetical protein